MRGETVWGETLLLPLSCHYHFGACPGWAVSRNLLALRLQQASTKAQQKVVESVAQDLSSKDAGSLENTGCTS